MHVDEYVLERMHVFMDVCVCVCMLLPGAGRMFKAFWDRSGGSRSGRRTADRDVVAPWMYGKVFMLIYTLTREMKIVRWSLNKTRSLDKF